MTPATETAEERRADAATELSSTEMPRHEEMRAARRTGVVLGILERNGLWPPIDPDRQVPVDYHNASEALVDASTDTEAPAARALVENAARNHAWTDDQMSSAVDAVVDALLQELRVIDEPFPGTKEIVPGTSAGEAAAIHAAAAADRVTDTSETLPTVTDTSETLPAVEGVEVAGALGAESPTLPIHRVQCGAKDCKSGATYRPTASGAGFQVLERYGMSIETTLGAGPHGRPICPVTGHGEMTLADDQLPIEQAINQVNERLEEKKRAPRLPFPAQPFNTKEALHHIYEKRHEVKRLEDRHDDLKNRTKKAKEELDEANEQLGKMIDDYEEREQERNFEIERRQRQAEDGHPEGTTLVRCTWEQQHPDDPCPLCVAAAQTIEGRNAIVRILGVELLPRDAQGHADQVVIYRTKVDVAYTADALDGVVFDIHPASIAEWSAEERAAVRALESLPAGTEEGRRGPRSQAEGCQRSDLREGASAVGTRGRDKTGRTPAGDAAAVALPGLQPHLAWRGGKARRLGEVAWRRRQGARAEIRETRPGGAGEEGRTEAVMR